MCVPILDGEIVHFDREGKPQFFSLLGRRTPQHVVAFDLLRRSASRPTRPRAAPTKNSYAIP
jgi:ATP-dependent DNA ligase